MKKFYASKTSEISQMEKEHMDLSRKMAGECMVLLENDGVLPMAASKIALFGNGARETIKGGTGSGDVNSRFVINVEEGLQKAGFSVTSKKWLDKFSAQKQKDRQEWQNWIQSEAQKRKVPNFTLEFSNPLKESRVCPILEEDYDASTETAIYVVARNSGEGADRYATEGDYYFYPEELEAIRYLANQFQKLIIVLNVGGVMELTPLHEIKGIGAILLMGQLGNIGGEALAQVLLGQVNPSGKLVDTFAKSYGDYPSSAGFSHNNGNTDDEYYQDDIYVGYRYFDSFEVEPLYPFGYGKSYTEFELTVGELKQQDDHLEVCVTVKNTGSQYAGKEVVQVYCESAAGNVLTVKKSLVAFQKTKELKPMESQKLMLRIPLSYCMSYSMEQAAWMLQKGLYQLHIGTSSRIICATKSFVVPLDFYGYRCRNFFASDAEFDTLRWEKQNPSYDQGDLMVDLSCLSTKDAEYEQQPTELEKADTAETITMDQVLSQKYTIEELVSQLTVEEMAQLCVGIFRVQGEPKAISVIGNAAVAVPGAAGETTSGLIDSRKIANLILADGPAGLRLTPEFEEEGVKYYQYCTAIPIAWSLAMSWNEQLVEQIGDMIGEEMEKFHVDLWLAPALNIHRNPLCGRNFEYYSEDPVVSGKMAAAITRGVQMHKGKGTTIKHFAANNLEDNRFFNNSHISEQALREIYLRGFEIAVRESQPKSIMTSYNLINGIHTPNRKDLLTYVARNEWGFQGFFMTDWLTSVDMPEISMANHPKYPISSSVGCIYAGNDLQMPGCYKNISDIVEAVNTGKEIDGYQITRADLEMCTVHILNFFENF